MEALGRKKNNCAPLIYKILINCFTFCGIPDRVTTLLTIDKLHGHKFQGGISEHKEFARRGSGLASPKKHAKGSEPRLYHLVQSYDIGREGQR